MGKLGRALEESNHNRADEQKDGAGRQIAEGHGTLSRCFGRDSLPQRADDASKNFLKAGRNSLRYGEIMVKPLENL